MSSKQQNRAPLTCDWQTIMCIFRHKQNEMTTVIILTSSVQSNMEGLARH